MHCYAHMEAIIAGDTANDTPMPSQPVQHACCCNGQCLDLSSIVSFIVETKIIHVCSPNALS